MKGSTYGDPIYNGAKPEYPCSVFLVPFRILRRSVFLAAFRGLRCAFDQLRSSTLRPTSVPNNEIAKTATFGFGVVRKGKEILGSGHFSRLTKPFVHPLIASQVMVRKCSQAQHTQVFQLQGRTAWHTCLNATAHHGCGALPRRKERDLWRMPHALTSSSPAWCKVQQKCLHCAHSTALGAL